MTSIPSRREEANAITCIAFRNGFLEALHAGKDSPLLRDPDLSRITDVEMRILMVEASAWIAHLLAMKENDPERYWRQIEYFSRTNCRTWVKDEVDEHTKPATTRERPAATHSGTPADPNAR